MLGAGTAVPCPYNGLIFRCPRTDALFCGLAIAAIAGRDGVAVRAGFRMAEEAADALVQLRADDVLKLAGLIARLGVFDGESVLEEALGQAMAAHNIACATGSSGRQLHFAILHFD